MTTYDNLFILLWYMRKKVNIIAKTYELEGLSCANCAAKFEKNLQHMPNVDEATVNFTAAKVTIQGDISIEQIESAGAFDGIKVKQNDFSKDSKQADRKSTRLNSSHVAISYAVFCLKKK